MHHSETLIRRGLSILLLFAAVGIHPGPSAAQPVDWTLITRSSDTLRCCLIDSIGNGNVYLSSLSGIPSTWVMEVKSDRQGDWRVGRLPVEDIRELVKNNRSRSLQGAGYGALAGAAVMGIVIIAADWTDWPGEIYVAATLAGAFYGSLLGGIIGALFGIDCTYDLLNMTLEEKIALLRECSIKPDD